MNLAIIGSSLLSSYWNGAATYYRGLTKELYRLGWSITFFEPDIYDRQSHRDLDHVPWARSVVYGGEERDALRVVDEAARAFDVLIKASGVGAFDDEMVLRMIEGRCRARRVFLDVDAPHTLDQMFEGRAPVLKAALPRLDAVLTYGGGDGVVHAYETLGARSVTPIYNAADPETHHPVPTDVRFAADLAFLGNRLPDREHRVASFFLDVARALPHKTFLIGGAGWDPAQVPKNVRVIGHVPTRDHNAFNVTPRAVLNIARESMAAYGFSPATRIFEAAAAGALIITDAWEGVDQFFEPGREILVAASGPDVAALLASVDETRAREIGARARARCLRDHTYAARARDMHDVLAPLLSMDVRRGVA